LAIAPALIVIAGALAYWFARPAPLEFRELASPAGFRELVVGKSSSRFGPLTGAFGDPSRNDAGPAPSGGDLCRALYHDPAAPAAGIADSAATIVEFFDYRCPYCKTLEPILAAMRRDGDARVIYREWPILGDSSELAARAALAAGNQGKYLEVHGALMASGFIPTIAYIDDLADRLGVDGARLRADMTGDDVSRAIRRSAELAAALGLSGTPALVVGRTIVQGTVTRRQLERLVATEGSAPATGGC
jgi:predicted DsbA family dithiol-disulfide isomerase